MTIKSNVGLPVVDILAADTSLLVPASPVERVVIGAMSLHNDGTQNATVTVEIFISADTTSAAGDRVAIYSVGDDASVDVNELIGEGLAVGENVIAIADLTGCNCNTTVTEYDGGS